MADYDFKYELAQAPETTNDGSGMIMHDIYAVARDQNAAPEDPFVRIGLHKTISIPYAELKTVMDMPDGTGTQKITKNNAYKDALASNLNTAPEPITGWSLAEMESRLDANDNALAEAARANDYIVNTLSQTYPVQFTV